MAPRLSGQTSTFGGVFFVSKSLLGIEKQKENFEKKMAILTRKPWIDFGILVSRTWPIDMHLTSGQYSFSRLQNPDCLIQISGAPAVCKAILLLSLLLLF